MDKIIILGGKGSAVAIAEQIYDTQIKTGNIEFLGFAFDDEAFGDSINGFPVLCKTYDAYKKYEQYQDVKFIFQLYRPDIIKERINLLESYGIPEERMGTFIHHSAFVAKSATIGHGCAILANAVINANAKIGNNTTIHSNSLVGHDTIIGDNNFIAAHNVIGSNTKIGRGNFLGLNCSINNYISIGDYNFVGMASNVIKGLENDTKVYGNPARPFEGKIKPL